MAPKSFPLVFHTPYEASDPIEIETGFAGLRLVFVAREKISDLSSEWEARGAYILLGPSETPGNYWARAGKSAPGKLRGRVQWHVNNTDHWDSALLIASTIGNGFNSAQAGYLEGRLSEILDAAPAAELHAGRRDHDDTLEEWQQAELEPAIQVVTATLRILGYSPETLDQQEASSVTRTRPARHDTSIKDLIGAGELKPGTTLRARWGDYQDRAVVTDEGELEIGGKRFATPSGAAKELTKRATNGWDFWVAPSGDGSLIALAELRGRLQDEAATAQSEASDTQAGTNEKEGREDESDPFGPEARRRTKLGQLVEAGELPRDALFVATYKGETYKAYSCGDGTMCLNIESSPDGDPQPGSPSAVAQQVTGRATNGWTFWKVWRPDGSTTKLSELRESSRRDADAG